MAFTRPALALFLSAVIGGSVACDVLDPPKPPPKPKHGTYLSRPFDDIRSLNDVITLTNSEGATVAYAVGTGGAILKYDGKKWTKEDSGVSSDLQSITGFFIEEDAEFLLIAGYDGTVLQRAAPGKWSAVTSGTTKALFSVSARAPTDAFFVGESGTILRFDGTVLTDQASLSGQIVTGTDGSQTVFPISEALSGVGYVGSDVVAVGQRGAVYRVNADDPTARWIEEDSDTQRPLAGIFTRSGVWIPATDGVLVIRGGADQYDDESFRTPAPVFLQDVYVDGADVYTVGLSDQIFHFDANVSTWDLTKVSEAAEMRGVDGYQAPGEKEGDPPVKIFLAVGGGGRIVRGPSVLPAKGETILESHVADADFVQ